MLYRALGFPAGVATAVVLSLIIAAPANAGGACTPQLEELAASLKEFPDNAAKEKAKKHYDAAITAEGNYDEAGCLEQLEAALEAVGLKATAPSSRRRSSSSFSSARSASSASS